jgi:uncharacterized protein YyaL (SSP411 family)
VDLALSPLHEVAILGDPLNPLAQNLVSALWSAFRPHAVVALSPFPPDPASPPLLFDRPLLEGRPTAYVCRNFVCFRPVNAPEDLLAQLAGETSPS